MIKITVQKEKEDIRTILISGHSGYDVVGKDIVCASVSSIATTTVNAILKIDENALEYEQAEGFLKMTVLKHNEISALLIANMLELLEQLQTQYSKFIKIIK